MPILKPGDKDRTQPYPHVARTTHVTAEKGAASLTVGELTIGPGGGIPTHIHPPHEEAMVVLKGTLEAIIGNERITVGEGATVLAPKGVKHGFVNTSNQPATLMFIFPTTDVQRVAVE